MLEDTIWAICDEYTWSLPAHISWAKDERTDVDLFASETGYALSEGWSAKIHQTSFKEHFGKEVAVYCIDYTATPDNDLTFQLELKFE